VRSIIYQVPGLITPIRQPSSMSCWAAMYTMMYSWRNQRCVSIRDAVSRLGQKYTQAFTRPFRNEFLTPLDVPSRRERRRDHSTTTL